MKRIPFEAKKLWHERPLETVAGALAIFALLVIGGYLINKRPGDILNADAEFDPFEQKITRGVVDWPTYGFNNEKVRFLPRKGIRPPLKPRWEYVSGALMEFSPILVRGRIFGLNNAGLAFSLDSKTGELNWKHDIGELNASSPAFDDGRLFMVNLEPGQVLALDADNGKRDLAEGPSGALGVLAGGLRRARGLRLRERRAVRPRRDHRQGDLAPRRRLGDQGRPGDLRRRRLCRRLRRNSDRGQPRRRLDQVAVLRTGPELRPRRQLLRHAGRRLRPRLHRLQGRPHVQLRGRHRRASPGATRPTARSTRRRRSPTPRAPSRASTSAASTAVSMRSTRRPERSAGPRTPAAA